jgi:hypothetical protein
VEGLLKNAPDDHVLLKLQTDLRQVCVIGLCASLMLVASFTNLMIWSSLDYSIGGGINRRFNKDEGCNAISIR